MLDFGYYNMDCIDGMKEFPDGYFDLAIVDPPYGGAGKDVDEVFKANNGRFGGRFDKYELGVHFHGRGWSKKYLEAERRGGQWASKYGNRINNWDVAPPKEYFDELFRVSKNQIIWGGNYFELPPTRCFLVWRKLTISENFSMAMAEYAWTSFNENAKVFEAAPQDKTRFHPTQKPIRLYEWVLANFAKEGDKILDTHVGSASSLIACNNMGFKYVGFEISKFYYDMSKERLEAYAAQTSLW